AGRGLGIGLVFQPLLRVMLTGLPAAELADANTLFNVSQRLGGSVGVNLLATVFTLRAAGHGALVGLHDTLAIATGVALVGMVCAVFLRSPADRTTTGAVAMTEPEPAG
ncbi:MAG: hypothetical protein J2P15_18565, partial [Micromonosporaceae bacterium]|nr:hypothetical protein [Micromonosporaceae bacterium]